MSLAVDAAAVLQPGFAGPTVPTWLVEARAAGLVSVCLYGDNVVADGGLTAGYRYTDWESVERPTEPRPSRSP